MGISRPFTGLMARTPWSITPVFSLSAASSVRSKSLFRAAAAT